MAKIKTPSEKLNKQNKKEAKDIFGDLPPLPEVPQLRVTPNTEPLPESNISEAPFEADAPVLPSGENGEVLTFEKVLERDLAKYDSVASKIQELKDMYLPLRIESVEDEEGYKTVSTALRFMVSKRTEVDEVRKALKADALAYGKAVDDKAKSITADLAPIEEHLRAEKEKIEAELRMIAEKKEEERKAAVLARHNRLIACGMGLLNDTYIFDNGGYETLHVINLELMDEDAFGAFARSVEKLHQEAIERKEKEEQDRIEVDKRQAAARMRILQESEELKKQQNEMAQQMQQMREEAYNFRKGSLEMMGMQFSEISPFVFYKGLRITTQPELMNATFDEYKEMQLAFKSKIESIDADIAKNEADKQQQQKERDEAIKKQALIDFTVNARKSILAALGFKFKGDNFQYVTPKGTKNIDISFYTLHLEEAIFNQYVEEWKVSIPQMVEHEAKDLAEQSERAQKLAEDERVANLSDKEKLAEYVLKLAEVPKPVMATKKWGGYLNAIAKIVNEYISLAVS
jgi:hypothetical protein